MKKIELSEIESYNKLIKDLYNIDLSIFQRIEYIAGICCERYNTNLQWYRSSHNKEIDFNKKSQYVIVGRNLKNNKGLAQECVLKFPTKWLFEDFENNIKNEDISFH
jgi:hypothetical protein